MTLMNISIALTLIGTILMVMSMFAIHRDLPGFPKGYRTFLGLLGTGLVTVCISVFVYNKAQQQLRAALDSTPRTVFRITTAERNYAAALAGADAACLTTHIKDKSLRLFDDAGQDIYPTLIRSLTADLPQNLPDVTPTDCAFKPSRIVFQTVR